MGRRCTRLDRESGSVDSAAQEDEKFQDEALELGREIGQIEKATVSLRACFASDSHDAREEIVALLGETDERSERTRARLRKLGEDNRAFKAAHGHRVGELKLRVTQHQALARRFMAAMQAWEDAQDAQRSAARAALEDRLRALRPDLSDEEVARIARDGDEDALAQLAMDDDATAAQRAAAQRGIADLKARTADIRKLEDGIVALHQLFVDMQIMVEAQGELLDGAEYNIVETKGATAAALDDLVIAREHQKSARKKKVIIAIVIIIILVAVAIGLIAKFAPNWITAAQKKVEESLGISTNTTASPTPVANPIASPTPQVVQQAAISRAPSTAQVVPQVGTSSPVLGQPAVRNARIIIGADAREWAARELVANLTQLLIDNELIR